MWKPTQPQTTPLTHTPYGFDTRGQLVTDVDHAIIRAIYDALKHSLSANEAVAPPIRQQALDYWLAALNESLGDTMMMTEAWVTGGMHLYSTEFFLLADHYARQLTPQPALYRQTLARNIIASAYMDAVKTLTVRQIYQHHRMLLQHSLPFDILPRQMQQNTVSIEWVATAMLAMVAPQLRPTMLANGRELIAEILAQLPVVIKEEAPANVSLDSAAGETTRWTVRWQTQPDLPWWALGGLVLTLFLGFMATQTASRLVDLAVFVPLGLGIIAELYQRWRGQQHAQEQSLLHQVEYAQLLNMELDTVYANLRDTQQADQAQIAGMEQLREAIQVLSTMTDRDNLLERAMLQIQKLLGIERVFILLNDLQAQALRFGKTTHPPADEEAYGRLRHLHLDLLPDAEINRKDPLLGKWLNGDAVMVEDSSLITTSRLNLALASIDFMSFFSSPMMMGDQFLGAILVSNQTSGQRISETVRALLNTMAMPLALALENARLYHLQDENLNQSLQELQVFTQIDRELVGTLKLNNVLELLLDWALRFTNAQVATVLLVEGQMGRIAAYYGCLPDQLPGGAPNLMMPLDKAGISGYAAQRGETQAVADVTQDPHYNMITDSIRANIAAPIMRQGRVVGVVTLESPTPFDPQDIQFTERLATRAGIALENARLYTEAEQERSKLSAILENTVDAVIVIDLSQNLLLVNRATMTIFQMDGTPEDFVGRPFYQAIENMSIRQYLSQVVLDEARGDAEIEVDDRVYHANTASLAGLGHIAILHDVTPFVEVDRLKSELISSVSHDLKNPLAVMKGYVDLIEMTQPLNEKGAKYIHAIFGSIEGMRSLIDDLLDLARIDSGLELMLEDLDMRDIIVTIEQENQLRADEKGLQFQNDFLYDMPLVQVDAMRIKQVVANFINNAVKYTLKSGTIFVQTTVEGDHMKIAIQDQGVGIPAEALPTIWDRFTRIRNEETKDVDGTGLGLAIVKSLVEVHGGTVGVESLEGEGSTFWFTVPLSQKRLA